jgi:hypothetical protein
MDAFCLSNLPSPSSQANDDINQNETTKEYGHVPVLTKPTSLNPQFIRSIDQQQLLRHSAKISRCISLFLVFEKENFRFSSSEYHHKFH